MAAGSISSPLYSMLNRVNWSLLICLISLPWIRDRHGLDGYTGLYLELFLKNRQIFGLFLRFFWGECCHNFKKKRQRKIQAYTLWRIFCSAVALFFVPAKRGAAQRHVTTFFTKDRSSATFKTLESSFLAHHFFWSGRKKFRVSPAIVLVGASLSKSYHHPKGSFDPIFFRWWQQSL